MYNRILLILVLILSIITVSDSQILNERLDMINKRIIYSSRRRVINPYKFRFVLESTPCTPDHDLLVVVHTSAKPKYRDRRMLLRATWLNASILKSKLGLNAKIVFFTGLPKSQREEQRILYEYELYGDIVQSTFEDNYYHNTYKAMSYLLWTNIYCPKVPLLMKLDDDVLARTTRFADLAVYMKKWMKSKSPFYIGKFLDNTPNRDPSSKWYVSREVWPAETYPIWFQGMVYFLSPAHTIELYKTALYTAYMHTDDVFLGILVNKTECMRNGTVIPYGELSHSAYNDLFYTMRPEWQSPQGKTIFFHMPNRKLFVTWSKEDLSEKPLPPWFQW